MIKYGKELNSTSTARLMLPKDPPPAATAPAGKGPKKQMITVLRIDPFKETISKHFVAMGARPDPAPIKALCKAKKIGSQDLNLEVDLGFAVIPLMAAGAVDISSDVKSWYVDYGQTETPVTGGIGLLFARGPGGGMIGLPPTIDVAWARQYVKWHPGTPEDAEDGCGPEGELP